MVTFIAVAGFMFVSWILIAYATEKDMKRWIEHKEGNDD